MHKPLLLMLAFAVAACAQPSASVTEPRPDPLGARPVRYDDAFVARVRAVGAMPDLVGVMDEKARVLVAVARLSDRELTEFVGTQAVPKAFVRELAVGFLAHSNLYGNVDSVRAFFADRVRTSTDEREQLLLAPVFGDVLHGNGGRDLARAWIDWIERALARMPDPIALEIVHARLAQLGRLGAQLGVVAEVRGLCDAIVASSGAFALSATGGERDLFQAAVAAAYDLDHPPRGYHVEDLPRERFDLWALYRDVPRSASDREFDQLAQPLLAPQIHFDMHTFERIAECFAVRDVTASRRARLMLRLLSLRAADVSKFDPAGVPDFTVLPRGVPELFTAAARAFAVDGNAALFEDGELRRKVAELAIRRLDSDYNPGLYLLHPVFMTLLRTGDAASVKPILTSWMQVVADAIGRKAGDLYYTTNIAIARMLALVELGPRVGLDAGPLIEAVLASPRPSSDAIYTHAALVRAAVVARETRSHMAPRPTGKQAP